MRCWAMHFTSWVQRFYGAERLFDLGDLPGAADTDTAQRDAEELASCRRRSSRHRGLRVRPWTSRCRSRWPSADTVVRGRIDAVFADADGGATVVDWKTGEPPHGPEAARQAAIQLGVYRLAWAALSGCPESLVRTAFHYVRTGVTVVPDVLPEPDDLAELLSEPAPAGSDCAAAPRPAARPESSPR